MPGLCLALRDQQPGGGAEERQARVAQEAAAPEPDVHELLVAETRLEIRQLPTVHWHTRLPPLDGFFFRDLYETLGLCMSAPGFHESDKVGGALMQEGLPGNRSTLDFQGERRALEI